MGPVVSVAVEDSWGTMAPTVWGFGGRGRSVTLSIFLWFRGPGSILPAGMNMKPTWGLESAVVVREDGAVGVSDGGVLGEGEGEGGGAVGDSVVWR